MKHIEPTSDHPTLSMATEAGSSQMTTPPARAISTLSTFCRLK